MIPENLACISPILRVIYWYVFHLLKRTQGDCMKRIMLLGLALLFSGCFGISEQDREVEYQIRHQKRLDCTQTKNTSETANITQCPKVRPDTTDTSKLSNSENSTE